MLLFVSFREIFFVLKIISLKKKRYKQINKYLKFECICKNEYKPKWNKFYGAVTIFR